MKKVTVVYVLLSCSSKWKHEAKLLFIRLSVRLSICLSVSCPALRMMRLSYRYFGTLIVVTPCWKSNPPVNMARVDTESSLFSDHDAMRYVHVLLVQIGSLWVT